jgi:hypothetical protein
VFLTLAVACGQLLGIEETRDQSRTLGGGGNSSGGENQPNASGGLDGADEAGQSSAPDGGGLPGASGTSGRHHGDGGDVADVHPMASGGAAGCSTCGGALEAGAAGAAGALAADWSPQDMPSLLLWLDAGNDVMTDGSAVVTWTAQSTLTPAASQAEAANRPTWQPNAFGSLPGIVFDGLNDVLVMSDTDARFAAQIGTGDFVISVAFSSRYLASSPEGMVLGKQEPHQWPFLGLAVFSTQTPTDTAGGYQAQLDLASQCMWTSPLDGVDYNGDKVHVLSMLRRAPELILRVDGREIDHARSQPAIDVRQPGIDFSVGAHWQGSDAEATQHFAGAVGEIVIGGASSLAVFAQLEDYLLRKYRTEYQ